MNVDIYIYAHVVHESACTFPCSLTIPNWFPRFCYGKDLALCDTLPNLELIGQVVAGVTTVTVVMIVTTVATIVDVMY